jgi:hypothetical protein
MPPAIRGVQLGERSLDSSDKPRKVGGVFAQDGRRVLPRNVGMKRKPYQLKLTKGMIIMDKIDNPNTINSEEIALYQTLDKDYGRTKFAGPGYGELDVEKYKELEELTK